MDFLAVSSACNIMTQIHLKADVGVRVTGYRSLHDKKKKKFGV